MVGEKLIYVVGLSKFTLAEGLVPVYPPPCARHNLRII